MTFNFIIGMLNIQSSFQTSTESLVSRNEKRKQDSGKINRVFPKTSNEDKYDFNKESSSLENELKTVKKGKFDVVESIPYLYKENKEDNDSLEQVHQNINKDKLEINDVVNDSNEINDDIINLHATVVNDSNVKFDNGRLNDNELNIGRLLNGNCELNNLTMNDSELNIGILNGNTKLNNGRSNTNPRNIFEKCDYKFYAQILKHFNNDYSKINYTQILIESDKSAKNNFLNHVYKICKHLSAYKKICLFFKFDRFKKLNISEILIENTEIYQRYTSYLNDFNTLQSYFDVYLDKNVNKSSLSISDIGFTMNLNQELIVPSILNDKSFESQQGLSILNRKMELIRSIDYYRNENYKNTNVPMALFDSFLFKIKYENAILEADIPDDITLEQLKCKLNYLNDRRLLFLHESKEINFTAYNRLENDLCFPYSNILIYDYFPMLKASKLRKCLVCDINVKNKICLEYFFEYLFTASEYCDTHFSYLKDFLFEFKKSETGEKCFYLASKTENNLFMKLFYNCFLYFSYHMNTLKINEIIFSCALDEDNEFIIKNIISNIYLFYLAIEYTESSVKEFLSDSVMFEVFINTIYFKYVWLRKVDRIGDMALFILNYQNFKEMEDLGKVYKVIDREFRYFYRI